MAVHHIKIDTAYVDAVLGGIKPFEVRKNDRGYQVGDHLIMSEDGDPGGSGTYGTKHWRNKETDKDCSRCRVRRYVAARISYVYGDPRFSGLEPGHVVLGLEGIGPSILVTKP